MVFSALSHVSVVVLKPMVGDLICFSLDLIDNSFLAGKERGIEMREKWEIIGTEEAGEAQRLANQGWELVSVTKVFETWENLQRGYTEHEIITTFWFKRKFLPRRKRNKRGK